MNRMIGTCWLSVALAMGSLVGCASDPDTVVEPADDALLGDAVLVPIERVLDEDTAARHLRAVAHHGQRSAPQKEFYLAVRKNTLDQKWFWSVYLKELQPFGPSPMTLGTKVVRFKEQNDKLYVFDADDRRATSDVFHPDLIIDAFPIVNSDHFNSLPGSGGYILIDPAAGLNRYNALSDYFATDPQPIKLETELSFVQDFHASSDGGRFEQIVTAYTDQAIGVPGDVDSNEYRVAATLGVNLRRYSETPGFTDVPAPPVSHYFLDAPKHPGSGQLVQSAVHWGFHPGMTPIKWKISPEILGIAADPNFGGGADLFAAMKRGIESWNDVFGYPVFRAELATAGDSFADDRVNYLIVDPDPTLGYAYADWRTNPNTGEIRGASVYIGGAFFFPLPGDPDPTSDGLVPAPKKTMPPHLTWQGQSADPLCVQWAPTFERRAIPAHSNSSLTGPQKLEAYIQEVITHEIGHTLGLRHNFKGSLVPPSSSVMDYSLLDESIAQPTPGAYDRQAIAFLYGQSAQLPTLPFCTDEDTLFDPNCVRFDPGTPNPLTAYQIPQYAAYTDALLQGWYPVDLAELLIQFFGPELFAYARAGTPADAGAAWEAALQGFRAPLDPAALASNPYLGPAADALSRAVFREIYVAPTAAITTPFTDPSVIAAIANDGKNILANLDGVRSYETRRVVIDALKKAQTNDAYLGLLGARGQIMLQLSGPGLSPIDQALTRDLLARLDAAITPYFE